MYGNELNYMQTCWTVGYVIGEIPSNILLTRIKPRYWIPAMEVRFNPCTSRPSIYQLASLDCSYNVLVSLQYSDSILRAEIFRWYVDIDQYSNVPSSQLCHMTGLAESTFYPGMQYIIGSWYRKDELAKRSCIFHTSSGIASMFSGYLMDAVYRLGGRGGFKGWQW